MRQGSLWLVMCVILGLGIPELSATSSAFGSFTKNNNQGVTAVSASWTSYLNAGTYPGLITCPSGVTPTSCGYARQAYGSVFSSLGPAGGTNSYGWHGFSSTTQYGTCTGTNNLCNWQAYLNSLVICTTNCPTSNTQSLGFALTGKVSLDQGTPNPVNLYRAPSNDLGGYYLSTPDSSTITIKPPSGYYFKAFDFYWGSVDPWNSIKFTDASNNTTTVYGTDLSADGFVITDTTHSSGNTANTTSATIDFTPACSGGGSCQPNWTSVTLKACSDPNGSLGGACYPAFEFDNLQFKLSTLTTGARINAPVPEPSSMMLLGTGILGISALLRRRRPRS